MSPKRVTPDERARIIQAIKAGGTCRGVADEFSRSTSTISRIAKAEGLEFDRSRTEAATKAKQIDNRARRAELIPDYITKAKESLVQVDAVIEQMSGPYLVFNFGGRDNVYNEHEFDRPPAEAMAKLSGALRDLSYAAKNFMTTVLEMERIDQPEAGHGALEKLTEAIRSARAASG